MILAAVAIGLLAWLRSLLGTRTGSERERVHPLIILQEEKLKAQKESTAIITSQTEKETESLLPGMAIAIGAKEGLAAIAGAEKGFSVRAFLTAAGDTYALVTQDFAKGDIEALKDLLAPDVAKVFEESIKERQTLEHTQTSEVHAILESEIMEAVLSGPTARITVRFLTEQVGATRDKDGGLIAGDPLRPARIESRWTFIRRVRDTDPRWWVSQT